MDLRVVAFEAWNITRFIFVTNKRREIAGASELITYLDRRWAHQALRKLYSGYDDSWRIEDHPVELLTAGAGAVKVLVRDELMARQLVTEVTVAALRGAPGLDVYGHVGQPFAWDDQAALDSAVQNAVAGLNIARGSRPGPDARFLRLPISENCVTTGLPAAVEDLRYGEKTVRSAESIAKAFAYGQTNEGDGLARLAELAGISPRELRQVVEYLQDRADWVAVIYVDGNGLGDVFGHFTDLVAGSSARAFADTLRTFTEGLDQCAREALAEAVATIRTVSADPDRDWVAPVLPLVLGGDDVVLLCDGRIALQLSAAFLRAYERRTAGVESVVGPLQNSKRRRLSASAGVAIVKAHHPFESAARLAYDLLLEAKEVKSHARAQPCSALAFHMLFDSTDVRLDRLRNKGLSMQPYVVSDDIDVDHDWVRGRRWADLSRRVEAINARDEDGERLLPATQLHDLRSALFAGAQVADGRLANLLPRYRERGLSELCGDEDSLFWTNQAGNKSTALLDAMDAASFWGES